MRKAVAALFAAAALAAAGCRGTVPPAHGDPVAGIASVLLGGRFMLPTGETPHGRLYLNLEGEGGGREAEVYRLPVEAKRPILYQVEPNAYRLTPPRSFFGRHQQTLKVQIEGRIYRVPFPRDILRKPPISINPTKVVALGVVEVTVLDRLPGKEPTVRVRLNDTVAARRDLVQQVIRSMMDPAAPPEVRTNAVNWLRALERAHSELVAEAERIQLYKPAP